MSLQKAYTLAHTAQCRLQLAASRPDRNLRFVVGHLMHYESLRLRIVEIEHDMASVSRSSAVSFTGTDHVDHRLQHKPSKGQRRRRSSPPPSVQTYDDDTESEDDDHEEEEEEDEDEVEEDEEEEEEDEVEEDEWAIDDDADNGLSLERFPSASAPRPHPASQPTRTEPDPPELEPDESDYSDDEEPHSPEKPSREELQRAVHGPGNELYATCYEGVRTCVCHGKTEAPRLDRMWELPPHPAISKQGVMRAVAQVRVAPAAASAVCTGAHLHVHPAAPRPEVIA